MKHIYRSKNRILGGVCAGFGEYFSIDPIIIRLLAIASVFFGGAGIIMYIIAWIVVPDAASHTSYLSSVKSLASRKIRTKQDVTKKYTVLELLLNILFLFSFLILLLIMLVLAILFSGFLFFLYFVVLVLLFLAYALTAAGFFGGAALLTAPIWYWYAPYELAYSVPVGLLLFALSGICVLILSYFALFGLQMLTRVVLAHVHQPLQVLHWFLHTELVLLKKAMSWVV